VARIGLRGNESGWRSISPNGGAVLYLIDSWIEAFEMQLSEDRKRTRDALPESIKKLLTDAVALQKQAKGLGKK
jgi:hypothetical protein